MTKNTRINLFVPMVLLLSLMLDGVVSALFSNVLFTTTTDTISRLIVICIVMLSFYVDRNHMILFGIIFGFLYDSYYTGILGIYISLFPIVIYLCDKMKRTFNPNVFVLILILIIQVSLMEFLLYGFYVVMDLAMVEMSSFLANRLGPTLLLNSIYMLVLYYPLKKMAQAITRE